MKRNYGFTLIELLIVVVILSIVVALSTPRFSATYKGMKITSEANRMFAFLQYVKNRSVNDSTVYKVLFLNDSSQFAIAGQEAAKFGTLQVDSSLKITCTEENLLFYPNGTASLFVITAEDLSGNQYKIFSSEKTNLIEMIRTGPQAQ
jgi:prepilin-type N-terminal cleavage/methylation domain-containing protein